jgi:predicted metal-dependent enzyme (double-stranded beta helix superfamily)
MSATDGFVAECTAARQVDPEAGAVREIVEQAVRDARLREELALAEVGVRILHHGADLTILHVVMAQRPTAMGNPMPHNHQMWAVIGVTHGGEDNEFFHRAGEAIESSGGRVLEEGDVLLMEPDTIHAVKNPSRERLSGALHVYGGDLIAAEKTMWGDPDRSPQPFDLLQVLAS